MAPARRLRAVGLGLCLLPLATHGFLQAHRARSTPASLRMSEKLDEGELFTPEQLRARAEATAEAAAAPKKKAGFWEWLDETTWDMFQGRKERIWAPDRRPEDERGAYDQSKSTLSWGDEEKLEAELFEPLLPSTDAMKQAAVEAPIVGLANQDTGPLQEGESKQDVMAQGLAERLERLEIESVVPDGPQRYLEGRQLAELCYAKYGRYHDMALLRNTGQVAINVYGPALGDRRGFGYTESQYLQKLDTVCAMLNDFDQAWFVREFLLEPIYPRRGLPSTPRADTAVTLRLNTSPTWRYVDLEKVEEWFSIFKG